MMANREKVIDRLETAVMQMHGAERYTPEDVDELEIAGWDALALLKEQEPRVLTTEELTQIEPWTVYWGEGNHVKNLWPMAFTAEAIEDLDSGFVDDSYGRVYEVEWYNKGDMGWRIWTSRPTDDQRKDTPWEGDVDEK